MREPRIGDVWLTVDDTYVVIDFQLSWKRWLVHESAVRNAPAFVVSRAQLCRCRSLETVDVRRAKEMREANKGKCFRPGDPVWVGTRMPDGRKAAFIMDIQPEWIIIRFDNDTRWQQNRNCFPCYAVKPEHVEFRECAELDDICDRMWRCD